MKILLTLDYELFNGKKCGSVENCLIKPMEELLTILDKYDFKVTLFVDTVFINRLGELACEHEELRKEYDKIVSQLKDLYNNGHDLQLHIHPNWLYATYSNGQWSSVLTDYKLSDMSDGDVDRMFSEGVKFLAGITSDSQSIVAYRAGAYCIQTYKKFQEVFHKYGIIIDSSVYRHQKSITEKWQYYDYTSIPNEYLYRFSNDVCKKDVQGSLLEVSIPTYLMSKIQLFRHKCVVNGINKNEKKKWGDGLSSINTLDKKTLQILRIMKARLFPSRMVASIDSTNGYLLKKIYHREKRNNGEYMLIMGHPKNFTPYSLNCLNDFLFDIDKIDDQFITINQFCKR